MLTLDGIVLHWNQHQAITLFDNRIKPVVRTGTSQSNTDIPVTSQVGGKETQHEERPADY